MTATIVDPMDAHLDDSNALSQNPKAEPVTLRDLRRWRREGTPFPCLTAYDATMARWLSRAGVPVLLVGDLGAVLFRHQLALLVRRLVADFFRDGPAFLVLASFISVLVLVAVLCVLVLTAVFSLPLISDPFFFSLLVLQVVGLFDVLLLLLSGLCLLCSRCLLHHGAGRNPALEDQTKPAWKKRAKTKP